MLADHRPWRVHISTGSRIRTRRTDTTHEIARAHARQHSHASRRYRIWTRKRLSDRHCCRRITGARAANEGVALACVCTQLQAIVRQHAARCAGDASATAPRSLPRPSGAAWTRCYRSARGCTRAGRAWRLLQLRLLLLLLLLRAARQHAARCAGDAPAAAPIAAAAFERDPDALLPLRTRMRTRWERVAAAAAATAAAAAAPCRGLDSPAGARRVRGRREKSSASPETSGSLPKVQERHETTT